jgi:hypothetical protein
LFRLWRRYKKEVVHTVSEYTEFMLGALKRLVFHDPYTLPYRKVKM